MIVNSLSEIGGNKIDILNLLYSLQKKGIQVKTLDGLVETKVLGKLGLAIVSMIIGCNTIEKSILRTKSLYKIAKKKEVGESVGGRPKTSQVKADLVLKLRKEGDSYREIRGKTGLALSTIRRIIIDYEKEL